MLLFADDTVICGKSRKQKEQNLDRWKFCFGAKNNEGQKEQEIHRLLSLIHIRDKSLR